MLVKLAIGITGSEKRISIKPVLLIDSIHASMGFISCSTSKVKFVLFCFASTTIIGNSARIMMLKEPVVSYSPSSIAFTLIGKVPSDFTLSGKSLIVTLLAKTETDKNS